MISVAFRSSIGRTAIARMRLAAARFFLKSFLRSDEAFCSESVVLQWFQGHLPNFAEFRLEVWTSIR
jgi:hypothetical protein